MAVIECDEVHVALIGPEVITIIERDEIAFVSLQVISISDSDDVASITQQ